MRRAVKTGLPAPGQPLEFAALADGILYTALVPVRPDGSVETGDATAQVERRLANLKMTVEAEAVMEMVLVIPVQILMVTLVN